MKKGFTLIELMVVIVIMGVLAAVAVPKLFGNIEKAKLAGVAEALSTFEGAVTTYYITEGNMPLTINDVDFQAPSQTEDNNVSYKPVITAPTGDPLVGGTAVLTLTLTTGGDCNDGTVVTTVAPSGTKLVATRGMTVDDACVAKLTKVSTGAITLVGND